MKQLRHFPTICILAISGALFTTSALADGPDGHDGPDDGHPPIDQRGGPDMPRHFAYKGHDFERGKPAPDNFRGDDYRVDDWRDKGLPPPPEGQHWSYVDGNYVLIAATTGIITSIILNSAHPR